ncbi:MAG TPA: MFS transporter [Candidatus Acidoferrum sp.]|nr:MFS transporter [Candidatus Acidoferrum sp.]
MSEQNSASTRWQSHRNLLVLLFAGFVLSGIATVIVGPMLPVFIRRWSLNDSQAGLFSTVQFMAAWIGTLASSAIATWRGYRPALVLGYAMMGGGLAFLNADTHILALTATATFGFGYGLLTAGTNLLVAELGGVRSASLVSLLNFMWGVGAMTCPLLIAFALKHNQISLTLWGCSAFGVVMVVGLLFASFGADERPHEARVAETRNAAPAFHIGFVLACLFFIYVSAENGIGIWAAEFSRRLANGITGLTTLAPTFFYGGLTLGRACAPLALRHLKEKTLVLGALALTAAGNTLLIMSPSLYVAIAAVFLAGLGCASVYPIYIAWLSRWYGARAKKIGGVLFALASLGGSLGPWLVGTVSQLSGSLRIGLLVPMISVLIMIGLIQLLRKQTTA